MQTILNMRGDWAMLLTRLIIGGIFVYSGWMKVSDMGMTLSFFGSMNIPVFLSYIVSYGELVGGVLLILGLWAELAVLFLGVVMVAAIYFTRSAGFVGFGLPLAMLGGLLAILGAGAGKYAVKFPSKSN